MEDLEQDGDLLGLHEHPRWLAVVAEVRANHEAFLTTVNRELCALYQADQRERKTDEIDWSVVAERDAQRRARALEIVAAGEARTADDWVHAAMLMQHSTSLAPEHHLARWWNSGASSSSSGPAMKIRATWC